MMLSERQLGIAIAILKAGSCSLSAASESDYVAAAAFIFDNGLMFYPGVASQMLEEELGRRAALKDATRGRGD